MAKYHAYSVSTSDGANSTKGYSHKQMMKFLQTKHPVTTNPNGLTDWLVEQKIGENGEPYISERKFNGAPVTATIVHEVEEIDFAHEAQMRGLQPVRIDEHGKIRNTEDAPYAKTYGVEKDKAGFLTLVEIKPKAAKTAAELAAEAEQEAVTAQKAADAAKAKAAALAKDVKK